jgi:phage terminase large subunit
MYASRTEFDDTTNVLKKYPDCTAIVVDNSEPQTTSEYQNIFPEMEATKKYAGSILDGIKTVRKYKIFVHHEAEDIIRENKSYKHAKNKQTSLLLEQPEDKNNHAMDAIRYAIVWYESAYGYAYDQ